MGITSYFRLPLQTLKDCLGAIVDTQLVVDVLHVIVDRPDANAKQVRDLLVQVASADVVEDLLLAVR